MLATEMSLSTAYDVLGVSKSNTLSEIRSSYREMAKTSHPDVNGDDPDAHEAFARISLAYEVLSERHIDPTVDSYVPDEQTASVESEVQIGNFVCKLVVKTSHGQFAFYESKTARLRVPIEYFQAGGKPSDFSNETLGLEYLIDVTIDVFDFHHGVLFTASRWSWESEYRRYERSQRTQDLYRRIDTIEKRLESLTESRTVAASAWNKVSKSRRFLEQYLWGWSSSEFLTKALNLIIATERECDKLMSTDLPELLVEALMAGRLNSSAHVHNMRVVREVNAASVRTGGFIDVINEQDLTDFYLEKITELGATRSTLDNQALFLAFEDYVPEGLLEEPELDTAPETVLFSSNKGQVSYPVHYRYDLEQPTAVVQLPLKVYERHAPEHGRSNSFPPLPHGIVWACEIVFDGKAVTSGRVNAELNAAVAKWRRGHRRSKHAEDSFTVGDFLLGAERSEVPPWYVGASRPGRRK